MRLSKDSYELHQAIRYNRADIVELFTSSSFEREYYEYDESEEIFQMEIAIMYADLDIFKLLAESDNEYFTEEDHENMFKLCIRNDRLDIIKYLVEDLNLDPNDYSTERYNTPPFFEACREGKLEIVKYLSSYFDINEVVGNFTSLGMAIYGKQQQVADYLIDAGFKNLSLKGTSDEEPIMACILNGWTSTANLLIDKGADVNRFNYASTRAYYPLEAAIKVKNLKIVKKLVEKGADPYMRYKQKPNAIEYAKSIADCEEIAQFLESVRRDDWIDYNEADCRKYLEYLDTLKRNVFCSLERVPEKFRSIELCALAQKNDSGKQGLMDRLASNAKNYKPWAEESPHWV